MSHLYNSTQKTYVSVQLKFFQTANYIQHKICNDCVSLCVMTFVWCKEKTLNLLLLNQTVSIEEFCLLPYHNLNIEDYSHVTIPHNQL